MILVPIISPFSVKKIPLIYWMILVPIISPFSVKNSPYLLDDPCTYNKSFLTQKIPRIY